MTAQTVSSALATRDKGPIAVMWSKKDHLDAVLPDSIDVKAFLGTAAGALYASDIPGRPLTLMKCAQENPDSLIVALMECAALGHLPGTDEYYLTPRTVKGRKVILGIEGYKGVIERMYRSGAVAKVVVREVCAQDPFRYIEGQDDRPVHEIGGRGQTGGDFFGEHGDRKRGAMVGAYAYAELTTGAVSRVVILTRRDVLAAREAGGWKPDDEYSPWNRLDAGKDAPEFTGRSMWWKTAAKRLEPWVPTSREYRASMLTASAKAAELAAPRRAELPPADLAVIREPVDAEIVDTPEDVPPAETAPSSTPPSGQRSAGGTRRKAGQNSPAGAAPPAGERQNGDLAGLIVQRFEKQFGVTDRGDRLVLTATLLRLDDIPASTNDIPADDQKRLHDAMEHSKDLEALRAAMNKLFETGEKPGADGEVPGEH